jgi:hypothetical protein
MQVDSIYPKLIARKGNGSFTSKDIKFSALFEIFHYPRNTIIKTQIPDKQVLSNYHSIEENEWNLDGLLDDRTPIIANNLFFKEINGNDLTLFSFKDLYFGADEISELSFAKYPLVGVYDLNFCIDIDGWKIECIGEKKELAQVKDKSKNWNLQFEGNALRLEKLNAAKDEYLSKANDITALLSLALGNVIVFNRQLYFQDDNLIREEWRRKVDYYFGADRCIPGFRIGHFLMATLSNFEKWDLEKRKIFFSTVTYINSSSKGYLDDRLLKISIAWEALAQKWSFKDLKSNRNELEPLKDSLKKAINEFQLPKNYEKDFVIDRVLKSLDWEKNTNNMITFCNQFNLNIEKIGLDFKFLNKIRNDVAHTGFFRKKYSKDHLSELLINHIMGLQVILLLELKYNGLIESEENKCVNYIKIEELLKIKTNP